MTPLKEAGNSLLGTLVKFEDGGFHTEMAVWRIYAWYGVLVVLTL